MLNIVAMFLKLLFGHCLADYPLQGDFLSKAKNHRQPITGVPWFQALFAHAVIQGGTVGFITGSVICGCVEFVLHSLIDYLKSDGRLSFNQDQAAHIACKFIYACCLIIL
ncbi:MAG: DUF3307 domain-containing protein [Blastocatellia bacterium]